jgi:hypothetical protein
MLPLSQVSELPVDDAELARRIGNHDHLAFEIMMRRNNGALYRVARAILKNGTEAEDVLQEAYLSAYRHIGEFRGDASLRLGSPASLSIRPWRGAAASIVLG